MSNKVWKAFERAVAGFFDTVRTPLSGENSRHTKADVIHPDYFIECKYRKKWSIFKLWRKTKILADKEDKIPILALKERDMKGWIVAVHIDDLKNIAKKEDINV